MRRKRRFSRGVHTAICLGLILLALLNVRLLCGPPPPMTERAALRRTEKRNLREPREAAYRLEYQNELVLGVWDGAEVQTYVGRWYRLGRKGFSYRGDTAVRPALRQYRTFILWRDSGDIGWGCPGWEIITFENGDYVRRLPLMVKNEDTAAVRGELTVTGYSVRPEDGGKTPLYYRWRASAERENPWFFTFLLAPGEDRASSVLNAICNGFDYQGLGNTAEAEIIWYDENGNELYRQQIELIEQGEGSEYYGA